MQAGGRLPSGREGGQASGRATAWSTRPLNLKEKLAAAAAATAAAECAVAAAAVKISDISHVFLRFQTFFGIF